MKKLSSITVKQVPKPNPQPANSEIRKHYFLDNYVIIAPKRELRPDSFSHGALPHKTSDPNCHFCHNTEPAIWRTPHNGEWSVKVIRNRFPALSPDNPKAYGFQEIVLNTPSHDLEFSELSLENIEAVFEAYRHRLTELKHEKNIRYTLIFKNDGPTAGASVAHAHCQIFALPLVPPKIQQESDALNHYWNSRESCAYCDIISWETQQKVRVIAEDKHFVAIAPYASDHAFEVWLLPRRHESQFAKLHASELHSLAVILRKVAAKLDSSSIGFNYFLQESLPNQNHHFVLKVEPQVTKWAGAELGTGIIINVVPPEYATLWYRGKIH